MRVKLNFFVCLLAAAGLLIAGCNGGETTPDTTHEAEAMKITDPHSHAQPEEAIATHLDLEVEVDFDNQVISGTAGYEIKMVNPQATEIRFDAHGLDIESVSLGKGEAATPAEFELGPENEMLGSGLFVKIKPGTEYVSIQYKTTDQAEALQFLDPVQTAGKEYPFLFTQSQAILARTWIPCQDGPGMRFTYHAKVKVPAELMAVMSASNPQEKTEDGVYEFDMVQPIPAYLMALSVGDLEFAPMGERTGVYAEPSMLEKSVYEFFETEQMLEAAEGLYGDYRWDRYDLIVLPPSFPFGGMENPRLTFVTPTVIAGDRSLTALIAHELAHSWSGNLVTNATWDDFWLNEGFTVYFERRIMEELYGESYVGMLRQLGYQDLLGDFEDLHDTPEDQHLKLNLTGRNPDDGMTDVAYEKGSFFLTHIENTVGREKFDVFLKGYFDTHAFQVMTTEGFVEYLKAELVKGDAELEAKLLIDEWIYQPGMPEVFTVAPSERFAAVDQALTDWQAGTSAKELNTSEWTSHEWQHFVRNLPESLSEAQMKELDDAFGFSDSGNNEVLNLWLIAAVANQYSPAYPAVETFLTTVGRRKFLTPLYKKMKATDFDGEGSGLAWAKEVYTKARPNYHAVSVGTMDELLGWTE